MAQEKKPMLVITDDGETTIIRFDDEKKTFMIDDDTLEDFLYNTVRLSLKKGVLIAKETGCLFAEGYLKAQEEYNENISNLVDFWKKKFGKEQGKKLERAIEVGNDKAIRKTMKELKMCCHCHEKRVDLKKCGKCEKVYYCSRECQVEDWKRHKKTCCKE